MSATEAVTRTRPASLILDADEVARRPWEPFGDSDDVRYRSLWIDTRSRSYAGVLRMNAGASVAHHAHGSAAHHVWVTEGDCMIDGRWLGAGSYVFVPEGTEHAIDEAGPGGCTLFYLYLR